MERPAVLAGPRLPSPISATRMTAVLFVFVLWALVITLRLAQFMVLDRGRYVAAMTREAVVEGVLPAPRGRILDRDGRVLAWSERVFALEWRVPSTPEAARREGALLAAEPLLAAAVAALGEAPTPGTVAPLATGLPAAEAVRLEPLLGRLHSLRLASHFRRHHVQDPLWREALGQVRLAPDGCEVGVNGLEYTHDGILRGQAGLFRVMRNSQGDWLPETWRKEREMRAGFDVQIPTRTGRPEPTP